MYFHTRYLADFLHMHNSLVKTLKMRPFKTRIYLLDKNYLMKKFLKYSQPRCHACFQHISPLAPADFSEKMMRMMTVDSKMHNNNILMTQVDGLPFQHLRWAWCRPVAFLELRFQLNRPKHIFLAYHPSDNVTIVTYSFIILMKPLQYPGTFAQGFEVVQSFPCDSRILQSKV